MKVELLIQGEYIGDATYVVIDLVDPDDLVITEEAGKCNGVAGTIFYIREKKRRDGYTYQTTAATMGAAKWVIEELRRTHKKWLTMRGPGAIQGIQ